MMGAMVRRASAIVLGLVLVAGPAEAADGDVAPERPFVVAAQGAMAQASVSMSRAGYGLFGDVGGQSAALRSFGRQWLLAWDVEAGARIGVLANANPYLALYGLAGAASLQPVYRLSDAPVSPAVMVRVHDEASVLWNGRRPLGRGRELNDMDGVGGITGRATAGGGAGVSWLDARRSVLVLAFVQEWFQTHGVYNPAASFTEIGVTARLDATSGFFAALEARYGIGPAHDDVFLDRTTRATRFGVGASARRIFANRMWLGAFVDLDRESQSTVFHHPAPGTEFDTSSPANFSAGVTFGIPIGGGS
jgi:hypothetical protein